MNLYLGSQKGADIVHPLDQWRVEAAYWVPRSSVPS